MGVRFGLFYMEKTPYHQHNLLKTIKEEEEARFCLPLKNISIFKILQKQEIIVNQEPKIFQECDEK